MADEPPCVEERWRGMGVSSGVARAEAHVIRRGLIVPVARTVPVSAVDAEWGKFEEAIRMTQAQIEGLKRRIDQAGEGTESGIFDAHLLILEDVVMLGEVERIVREQCLAVDAAFFKVVRRYEDALKQVDDEYLSERAADMEDVAQRVLRNLQAIHGVGPAEPVMPETPHIIVARDLRPSETANMDRSLVRGFVTEMGSQTSHTAIIARSLGIPAVVAVEGITEALESGVDLLVDGFLGLVVANPSPETLQAHEQSEARRRSISAGLESLRDLPAETTDGFRLVLAANVEFSRELPALAEQGADGIGLYRTEFLYLKGEDLPAEEEQTHVYLEAVKAAGPEGVIFRTFDVGGDKLATGRLREPEPNPFLGWRGIRVSLVEQEIFRTQVRAILRASAAGKVRIMFPMIATVGEVRKARAMVRACMDELRQEQVAFDEALEVGVMIEVPGAAMIADVLAREVDFFSIGSNDLTQYALAVDRVNERVADLYQPTHPGVLRLMQHTVDAAHEAGIWAGICGEMGSDVLITPLLVGLGLDELSVGSRQILRLKRALRALNAVRCRDLVARAMRCDDGPAVYEMCRQVALECYPDLLE